LASNLRPTTQKCVHLVTRGHFRSHDKDGGHTIRFAVAGKTQTLRIYVFVEAELLPIKILHFGNMDFFIFLLLWPWP